MPFQYTPSGHDEKQEKLEELILFIASRSEQDPLFGSVKLNKLLFYADFLAYVKLGKAITEQEYMRLPKGPAPRVMLPTLKDMEAKKTLARKERDFYGRTQKVPVALREANLEKFTADEIAVVTEVINTLKSKNAKGISTLSHKFDGWKLAGDRETIPYEVALVELRKPRKADIQKVLDMGPELSALRKEANGFDADEH
jgi:hypothetical protein